MYRILFALVLLLPLSPAPSEAFLFREIVYCSPIEGLIHWQGKPLANVVVTRELYSGGFEGGKYSDTSTTGSDGRFKFEVVQERRFLRPDLLSANPYVGQVLFVSFEIYGLSDFAYLAKSTGGAVMQAINLGQPQSPSPQQSNS
ncbi:DUF6795 domain-containing protein [Limnobacter sp.]|uniref:DUF6795 domain-containing protein n=1 Tax=Limnobacter sp. TaxID=2003368 RepID=UPI0039C980C5